MITIRYKNAPTPADAPSDRKPDWLPNRRRMPTKDATKRPLKGSAGASHPEILASIRDNRAILVAVRREQGASLRKFNDRCGGWWPVRSMENR